MTKAPELFGNEEDTAVQRAVYRLWPVLSAHPKLCTNGRTLGFCDPSSEDVPIILELAKAFGRIGVYFTTPEVVEQVRLAAIQERLETAQGWLTLNAKTDAAKLCEGIIAQNNPQGYDLLRIANDTPGETISEFQSLQEESGLKLADCLSPDSSCREWRPFPAISCVVTPSHAYPLPPRTHMVMSCRRHSPSRHIILSVDTKIGFMLDIFPLGKS